MVPIVPIVPVVPIAPGSSVRSFGRWPALRRAVAVAAAVLAAAAAQGQAGSCAANPVPGCLYAPAAQYNFDVHRTDVAYTDITGTLRQVPVAVRIPLGAAGPLPVVIWSHGGAEGHRNPRRSVAEWSEVTARAGYLTISLAHVPRERRRHAPGDRGALCAAIDAQAGTKRWNLLDPLVCDQFKYLNWGRPHDLIAVLDALPQLNAQPPLRGLIDLERVALAGHSAGSGGVLTVGGAWRNFTGDVLDLADPRRRPKAYLAFSPQQPGNEGFFDTDHDRAQHSWDRLTRPVLVGTGDGDSTCQALAEPGSCFGDLPYGRRIPFERLPPGDKALLYLHDARTFHGLFGLETTDSKCTVSPLAQQRCDEAAALLAATAVAFLDAHLKQRPQAEAWLAGGHVEIASGGRAELSRR